MAACAPKKNQGDISSAEIQSQVAGILGGILLPKENPISKNIVAVYDNLSKALCTGSLTKDNLVITAAHCVPENKSQLFVIFSSDIVNVESADDLQIRKVDKAEVSPYWAEGKKGHKDQGDIALIHYVGETPAGYKPSTLLWNPALLKKGAPVVLAGYGISNGKDRTGSGILRATFVTIDNPAYSSTEVTLDQTQGRGACHGDSGGPAYIYNKITRTYFLWGVTSRGVDDPKDDCTKYSAYTNILTHTTWLKEASKRLTTSVRDLPPKIDVVTK
jgi:hypothetical protein